MDEWYTLCQQLLKSSFGMDLHDFIDILDYILGRRLQLLQDPDNPIEVFDGCTLGRNHTIFDINRINDVSKDLRKELLNMESSSMLLKCEELILRSAVS